MSQVFVGQHGTRPAQPLFGKAAAAALVAGISIATWSPALLPLPLRWLLLLAGAALWLRASRWRWLGALLVGIGWLSLHMGWVLAAQLSPDVGRTQFDVRGTVVSLPEHEQRRSRFRFRVDGSADMPEHLRGCLLQLAWHDDFAASTPGPRKALHAGEVWQLCVRLRAPRGLVNPGGFDSERHAVAQRICATGAVRAVSARRVAPASGLQAWRERMAARITDAVASPSSRHVRALALGDTRGLDEGDWQRLRATGLTHLIAISGFHVGMVALCGAWGMAGLWRLFPVLGRHWPRPQAAAAGAFGVALGYAAIAGFALPTVRTVVMIGVVVPARLWRRPSGVLGALALAAVVVLLGDPLSILLPGFWLSYAGVAWLAACLPERSHWLRGFFSAQWVATLGLLPLTVLLFGQASMVGPLANLVAIPWWSLVVVPLALLGLVLEALWAGAGALPWRLSAWCFDLSWPMFEALAGSRFALWWLAEPAWFALPLALLGALWMLLPVGVPGRALALLLWLPLLLPALRRPETGAFEMVLLDVGQGLSVVLLTRQHALLYDTGPAARDGFDAGERVVVPALHALGVRRLDRLVLSHGDMDHAGGLAAVRAALPVAHLSGPPGLQLAGAAAHCASNQSWEWDGVRFSFLHPGPLFPYLRNESSCVLRVQGRHGAVLLTGDIGEVIEQRLVRHMPGQLRAEVVLVPHHGSAGSSTPAFVAASGARLALIGAGHGNRFGHPKAGVVARWRQSGAEVLNTADSGAVRVWFGPEELQLREQRLWRRRAWDAAERARTAAILSAD